MGKDSGTAATRPCALAPPALPLALAALLFMALSASAEAGQAPARVDEVVNVRAGRGLDTPRVLRLAPGEQVLAGDCQNDWCAVSRPGAPDQLLGYVFAPLLRPQAGSLPVANPVSGTEFILTPSLSTHLTYDNNVMFQNVSDQVAQMSPNLECKLSTERTALVLQAGADVLRYAQFYEFNRVNSGISLDLQHAATESVRMELQGQARSDHSFESALAESGEIALKNPHHVYTLQPALEYRLDERTEVRLGGETVANRYPNRPRNDAQTRGGNLGLTRRLDGGAASLLARAVYTIASYNAGDQDTATLAAGMDWRATETLSFLMMAGPALSRDEFSAPADDETHLGLAGVSRIRFTLENAEAELGGDIGTVSGFSGEDTLRRRLTGDATIHLSEYLDMTLAGAWYRSRSRALVRERESTTVTLSPGLRYALDEHASLNLEYGYTCIDDHVADVYRQRQQVSLSLHLEFPRMLR